MLKIEFKDAYGEALQPFEADNMEEAEAIAEQLDAKGYMDIEVVSE